MAELIFNLSELFERAFGYRTRAFEPEFAKLPGNSRLKREPYYAKDSLGNQYFMPVTIEYPDASNSTTGQGTYPNYQSWQLPYPVIAIESSKTIVETPLTERSGTVKELITVKDYEITIKGFMIAPFNEFPEEQLTRLRSIYEMNLPVSIKCPLTDIFLVRPDRSGSDNVVITELKFPAISGVKNVKPYELKLVSSAPFNLITI